MNKSTVNICIISNKQYITKVKSTGKRRDRMIKYLLLCIILFSCLIVTAQSKQVKYKNKGIDLYNAGSFKKALHYFVKANNIMEKKQTVDSNTAYYAGVAALKDSNFNKSIVYFQKSIQRRYKINKCVLFISDAYKGKNDWAKAEKTLKDGMKIIPKDNNDLIVRLTNLYIARQQLDSALVYLTIAIKNDPDYAILYFTQGAIYQELGNDELTIQSYKMAIKFDSAYFDPTYNLASLYYNQAADLYEEQQKIPLSENKKYEDLKLQINDRFGKALPYLENCYRINQNNVFVNKSLRIVYDNLQLKEKSNALQKGILLELLGKNILNAE